MQVSVAGKHTVGDVLQYGVHYLASREVPEARVSAEALLGFVLHRSRIALYVDARSKMNPFLARRFQTLLDKRSQRYPLQYLLRSASFLNTELTVGEGCLIPRPETEALAETVLRSLTGTEFEGRTGPLILDIGTGSGNLAVALALERPWWKFLATDISNEALEYARANAEQNHVEHRIRFVRTDLWEGLESERVDALVSNPPYLSAEELDALQPEVAYEPRVALDGKEKGLRFFERIAVQAPSILKSGGSIFFEVGCEQAKSVSEILVRCGFRSIDITCDDAGVPRVVEGRYG